jgi:hypothetical protein
MNIQQNVNAGEVVQNMVLELRAAREQTQQALEVMTNGLTACVHIMETNSSATVVAMQNIVERMNRATTPRAPFHVELPGYKGDSSENVNTWIKRVELIFGNVHVPVEERGSWARHALQGLASQFVESLQLYSWEDIKSHLRERFMPHNQDIYLREKLYKLKQVGVALDKYILQFQEILSQLEHPPEEMDKITYFLSGLRDPTREAVLYERPRTLQDAISRAVAYESAHGQSSATTTCISTPMDVDTVMGLQGEQSKIHCGGGDRAMVIGRNSGRNYRSGHRGLQRGSQQNRCFVYGRQDYGVGSVANVRCFRCNQFGHRAIDCRNHFRGRGRNQRGGRLNEGASRGGRS